MAILAALVAFGSRFASKVLTTALGWASTLLFGRVPASRQILLLGITFGSVIWLVMLAGFIVPDLGTFLLLLIPPQDFVSDEVIRLIMLIGVIVVPGVVGLLTLALTAKEERQGRRALEAVARGYPLTILLAVLLVFLAVLAIWRKGNSLVRRWTDAHVPMVVKPGAYDQVADDLDKALTDAGFDLTPETAPATMSMPAKWLAAVAGRTSSSLVPDRMLRLRGKDLDILIYPMDILISGKPDDVTRARAAMASRLTTSAAHLTVTAEAQAIEDRLTTLAKGRPTSPTVRRGSTRRRQPSSRRSTRRWPRSGSRTRSGRCSTASASRSNVTCAPGRWPARPWSGPRHRASTGRRGARVGRRGCSGRARPRWSRRRPTTRRSRPSTSWPVRAGGWPRRPRMSRWWRRGRPSAVRTGRRTARRPQQRASRRRSGRPASDDDERPTTTRHEATGTTGRSARRRLVGRDGPYRRSRGRYACVAWMKTHIST